MISSVALTADGKWALTGSTDNNAVIWDLAPSFSTSFEQVVSQIGEAERKKRSFDQSSKQHVEKEEVAQIKGEKASGLKRLGLFFKRK